MAMENPAVHFRGLVTMPTSLSSEELTMLDPIIRQRTFFSARVEGEKFLEGVRSFVQECIDEGVTEGEFLRRVGRWLRENREFLGDEVPQHDDREEWTTKESMAYERSVRHIDSLARLRLIYRTQAEMCAGWNQYREDMQPEQLRTWPGWQFVRRPGAKTFRPDHVEHENEIRLKTDVQFWLDRNSADQGGFENPYPPFGFNSWMWVYPVGRRKCVALGLLAEGETVSLPEDVRRKYGLDEGYAVDALKRLLDKLCRYQAQDEPAEAPTRPAKETPAVDDQPQGEKPDKGTQEGGKPTRPECDDWGGIPEELQKEIRDAVQEINEECGAGVEKVEVLTADPIEQGDDIIAISEKGIIIFNDGYYETGGIHSLPSKISYPPDKHGFTRDMVGSTPAGISMRCIVLHEAGHHACFNAGMMLNNPNDEVRAIAYAAYTRAVKSGDIARISKYAAENELEFFAECYSAHLQDEQLADYMLDMVEKVIKMGSGKGGAK